MRRRTVLFTLLLLVVVLPATALEGVDFNGGLTWISSPPYAPAVSDGTPTGGPSPLLNAFGLSFPFPLGEYFRLSPRLSLFGTQYAPIPGFEKVVPVEFEYASAVWFLGALVDLSIAIEIPIGELFGLGFHLGPSFLGRIPIDAWGDGWDRLDAMVGYLYGDARYFFGHAGASFVWKIERYERLALVLSAETHLPVFHFWDDEEVPFIDQMMVSGSIGLRIYARKHAHGDGPEPESDVSPRGDTGETDGDAGTP